MLKQFLKDNGDNKVDVNKPLLVAKVYHILLNLQLIEAPPQAQLIQGGVALNNAINANEEFQRINNSSDEENNSDDDDSSTSGSDSSESSDNSSTGTVSDNDN